MSYFYYLIAFPFILYIIRKFFNGPRTLLTNYYNVKDKVIIITGSSAGIGKETAYELLRQGAQVIFACRDEKKTKAVIQSLPETLQKRAIFLLLDLASFKSVKSFVKNFSELNMKVDIIINNAGCIIDKFSKTEDGIESVIQCNHLSHMLLTTLLLKHLSNNNCRIINVSSDAHFFVKSLDINALENDFEFKDSSLYKGSFSNYAYSKIANIYFTIALAEYLESKKLSIKTVSLHPGAVLTEIFRPSNKFYKIIGFFLYYLLYIFFKDAFMGAQTTLHVCYADYNDLTNGAYYSNCKISKMSDLANNKNLRNRFMDYSKRLIQSKNGEVPEEMEDLVRHYSLTPT
jgi:NAD(P)-dependent dehydrogenase (short-subunit alcohol dehydrogenase family)